MHSFYLEFRKIAKNKLTWLAFLFVLLVPTLVFWNFHRTMYEVYPLAMSNRVIKLTFPEFYVANIFRLSLLLFLIVATLLQGIESVTESKLNRVIWVNQCSKRWIEVRRNSVYFLLGLIFVCVILVIVYSFAKSHALEAHILFPWQNVIILLFLSYSIAYSSQLALTSFHVFRQFWLAGLINVVLYMVVRWHPLSSIKVDELGSIHSLNVCILLVFTSIFYSIHLLKLVK